jgi:hypothetical protein
MDYIQFTYLVGPNTYNHEKEIKLEQMQLHLMKLI